MSNFIIDSREPATHKEKFGSHKEDGWKFDIQTLPVGDYYLLGKENITIERKTPGDMLNSVVSKRFYDQVSGLAESRKDGNYPLLLIEGNLTKEMAIRNWHPFAVYGILTSVLTDFKIPVFQTPNLEHTFIFLTSLWKQNYSEEKKEFSLRSPASREMTYEEKAIYLLEGIQGIGPKTAKKLLSEFETPYNIFTKLDKVEVINKRIADEIRRVITTEVREK